VSDIAGREIRVPGSISNLGPALDTLAVAVELYLRLRIVEVLPASPDTIAFEFVGASPTGENRIETAFRHARARIGTSSPGLRVQVQSDIPMRAGIGSSGAAAVAGLRLYEAVTAPRPIADWLALATDLEGHPDNASAALLGGLAASCQREGGAITACSWRWPASIALVVATPEVELETSRARRALPQTLTLADAIFNMQRTVLLIRALETGDHDDLREAMRDRWHQPARTSLVPGLAEALALDDPSILSVCLSGSGPSVLALARTAEAADAAGVLGGVYTRLGLPCTLRTLRAHHEN